MHMLHAMVRAEERARIGVVEGLIRLSVGIEPYEQLAEDLEQALQVTPLAPVA